MITSFSKSAILIVLILISFVSCDNDKDLNETPPVTDIDGNTYNTVKIGDELWMAQNLRVTRYADGTPIPNVTSNNLWGRLRDDEIDKAFCYCNNDKQLSYGLLYTYAAATNGNNSGHWVQGACPTGWHIPNSLELSELVRYLDDLPDINSNMSGCRFPDSGEFFRVGTHGYWWSCTPHKPYWSDSTMAYYTYLKLESRDYHSSVGAKSYGFAVRCIKD